MNKQLIIKKASELEFNPRPALSQIFVEAWYDVLKMLCKNQVKLNKAFEHIFQLDKFYVAICDGEILSSIALSNRENQSRVIHLDKKELQKHLGFFRGMLIYTILHKELIKTDYAIDIPKTTGVIEFVATAKSARGQGLAGKLIAYAMQTNHFNEYLLEVADNNQSAIKLYQRLGFSQFHQEKSKRNPKLTGFEYMLYMRR